MNLKHIKNDQLIATLKQFVATERQVLIQILNYLKEVEIRKLHLDRAHPSMFEFCRRELGYSEAEAHIRIQAMRLLRDLPHLEKEVEEGNLTLSVMARAQAEFRRKEKAKSPISLSQKSSILNSLKGASAREAERKLAAQFPLQIPKESARALDAQSTEIKFVASEDLMLKLERLKDLTSHTNPYGRWDELIDKLADIALKKLDPLSTRQVRAG